jgi:lipid II:glycine glycyltransferase (peptidoglycan interpeptide bridge formation enzyme)
MITTLTCKQQTQWNREILTLGGHPLQLWGWGEVKSAHNWKADRVFIYKDEQIIGAAQLLVRSLPWPLREMVYIPRGPVASEAKREVVLDAITDYVKQHYSAVSLTIEPDWENTTLSKKWQKSENTILIPRTLILDLHKSEDELLGDMSKKTRQYIRKSASDGVEIKKVINRAEIAHCLEIYKQTASRAHFALHNDNYYYDIFDKLGDHSVVMTASSNGEVVAFLWLVISESVAFELYGGMNDEGQQLRANYTLKWEAIRRMKEWGIKRYDFNGLLNDGVSTFKQGFANHENMLVGTYEQSTSPLYIVWTKGLPISKKVIRFLKNRLRRDN